jgi:hypothetical protein
MADSNVYSLNVVGYYNVPVAAGAYTLVANQLNTTNNTITSLFPPGSVPDGFQLLKYAGGWAASVWSDEDGTWNGAGGAATLNMSEGALVKSPQAATLTFVGEVQQGTLTVAIPQGVYAVRSSIVPQAGKLAADLGYVPADGDQVLKYSGGWSAGVWSDEDGTWNGAGDQTFAVGEGMMFKKTPTSTGSWVRTFTVQ